MSTRRKVLLLILVVVSVVQAGIYWKSRSLCNDKSAIEKLNKELAKDLSELQKMVVELGAAIENEQQLPSSTNGVTSSYHYEIDGKKNYEEAWILPVKNGVFSVRVIDSRALIFFRPEAGDIDRFKVGYVAPVTFDCVKDKKGECDFSKPYRLYVSNRLVKMEKIEFANKN